MSPQPLPSLLSLGAQQSSAPHPLPACGAWDGPSGLDRRWGILWIGLLRAYLKSTRNWENDDTLAITAGKWLLHPLQWMELITARPSGGWVRDLTKRQLRSLVPTSPSSPPLQSLSVLRSNLPMNAACEVSRVPSLSSFFRDSLEPPMSIHALGKQPSHGWLLTWVNTQGTLQEARGSQTRKCWISSILPLSVSKAVSTCQHPVPPLLTS